ncbi:MAG: hypothetical protein ACTSRI_11845 [Promethearchaeota archaeon]
MKHINWLISFGIILILLSFILYYLQFLMFHDISHLVDIMFLNLAFLPLNALFITIIVQYLLMKREKNSALKRIYIVIGTFFNEIGNDLVKLLSKSDPACAKIFEKLDIPNDWNEKQFKTLTHFFENYNFKFFIKNSEDIEIS